MKTARRWVEEAPAAVTFAKPSAWREWVEAIQEDAVRWAAEQQREADVKLFGDAVREWEMQPASEAQSLASAHFDRYRAAMGMRSLVQLPKEGES